MTWIGTLRADLTRYTLPAVVDALGADAFAALNRDEAIPADLATRTPTQLNTLIRFFWLGLPVSDSDLSAALPTAATKLHTREIPGIGPIAVNDGGVWRSLVQLVPFQQPDHLPAELSTYLFASDPGSLQGKRHGHGYVMGIGGATRTLADLATYRSGERVLDLGTGCGIHAILAARQGAEVVASDLSERALAYARFNAELNDVRLQFTHGSMFEPVSGDFDVIVSNPPFVITPPAVRSILGGLEYRDGGARGDALLPEIIRQVARFLRPGGRLWMLANWESTATLWRDRLNQWFDEAGLNAYVIQRENLSASQYVEMWLHDSGHRPGDPQYSAAYSAWLTDFRERAVENIGFGYIMASRPVQNSTLIRRFDDLRGPAPASLFDYTSTVWNNLHTLGASTAGEADSSLLGARLRATGVVQNHYFMTGQSDPILIKLSQTAGFGEEIVADTALAGFVSVCDGELTTGQIIAALAELLSRPAAELQVELLPQVANLLGLGMLESA